MSDAPLFVEIAEYAHRKGVKAISALPGCWEVQIDAQWWMAVNGHRDPTRTTEGAEVPPFSAYVMFNGWPAGVIDPGGGAFAAGELANEASFVAALRGASVEVHP